MNKKAILICIDGMAAYYLKDSRLRMPHLAALAEKGTAAEKMVVSYPSSTWTMNTTMITGAYPKKHGVLGNWVVDRECCQVKEHFGDRTWNKEEVVKIPTLYDIAHQNGFSTAGICWPVTRMAKHIDYNIPEFYEQELFEQYCTPEFWDELKELGLPVDRYGPWSKDHPRGPMQDWLTAEIAKHLIRRHQPDFMMLHFLVADSFQHDYGTCTPEVFWALEYIDSRIGEIIGELKANGLSDQTDVYVVSDHGFMDAERVICPNVLFKQKGWYNPEQPETSQMAAVSNGGVGFVYFLDAASRSELYDCVKQELMQTGGVEQIFETGDFHRLELPELHEHPHQPDLIFEAADGYFVNFDASGEEVIDTHKYTAMHGYLPYKEQLKAVFIAGGPSIRSGHRIGEIRAVDVAPTIAKAMGLELEHADGSVLVEALLVGEEVES